MINVHTYKNLVKERTIFLEKFKRIIVDTEYRAVLKDLTGYFDKDNVIIDQSAGSLIFNVGDYRFAMMPKIFQSESEDIVQTNRIVFRTFEDIRDLPRNNAGDRRFDHIMELDVNIYFANHRSIIYPNGSERISYSTKGFPREFDISNNIVGAYCDKLIKYIKDLEGIETDLTSA